MVRTAVQLGTLHSNRPSPNRGEGPGVRRTDVEQTYVRSLVQQYCRVPISQFRTITLDAH